MAEGKKSQSLTELLKISFEFSSKLGVRELPQLDGNHQSNVPGLYVAGDLADAPIIKVALNQGYEIAEHVVGKLGEASTDPEMLDVVVIGAGPAGIGAALALHDRKMRYVVLEKERPFATIQNFPKAKHIFSEPRSMESKGNFWFEDAQKEDLVARWDQALDNRELKIKQPEEVVSIDREGTGFQVKTKEATYRCRKVILAIGRRGSVRKLNIPGEQLDKVAYALKDPDAHAGRKVLIVGGGDSAVEAAVACAESGADVTVSYRKDAFARAKAKNQQRIGAAIEAGKIRFEKGTTPSEIREDVVVLKRGDEVIEVPNQDVLVFIGTKLPAPFLKKIGIRMAGQMDLGRAAWVISFALMTYLFYVLKAKRPFFPFGPDHFLGRIPELLKVDLGFREVGPSFWGTVIYALLILGFGIKAIRRYPSPTQKKRYISLITFQWLFLFGIPEIIAPAVIKFGSALPDFFARPWKFYALTVPWPLSIWSMLDGPGWGGAERGTAIAWIIVGAAVSFVIIPLYVRKHGQRFCSYMCGCGGLAETLGDQWRHLAPRGLTSYKAEWFGRLILLAAIPVTFLILNDTWHFFASGALHSTAKFAQQWYGLMVDFWFASVVGVALYPYLGNRVWCRFICPLRTYMELLARRFSKITIKANDKCIGCGECTRFCQMGIQVQKFAQRQVDMDNSNSSCIQCGICVQVCPMEVLSVGERNLKDETKAAWLAPETGPKPRKR